MLYLELRAEFDDHFVIEIGAIVCDNPFGDVVAYETILDELSNNVLGNRCKRGCFHPLGKVINCHKDETVSIGGSRFDLSDHVNAPHCKRPWSGQNIQWNWRYVYSICVYLAFVTRSSIAMTISFHGGPIVTCSRYGIRFGCFVSHSPLT